MPPLFRLTDRARKIAAVIRRDLPIALLIAAAVFAVVAPTLTWLEFSSGSENLVVAAALETRRAGNWLIPTMQGRPRIAKPPLPTWLAAAAIRQSTLDRIHSPDAALRREGYRRLGWDVRWPALLAGAMAVAGTYLLARVIADRPTALAAAAILATSYAFLRFSRMATTDVQLMLWVVWANFFLALALVRGERWAGMFGLGLCAGLAFMSKGPVGLAQTLAPGVVWLVVDREVRRAATTLAFPAIVGLVTFAAVALPWFVLVILKTRAAGVDAMQLWKTEVIREGATGLEPSKWYAYVKFFGMVIPWVVFVIAGVAVMPQHRTRRPLLVGLVFTLTPILIMTCFRDRKDRYLLPMMPAAAIFAAGSVRVFVETWNGRNRGHLVVGAIHWMIIAAAAVVFPVAGMYGAVEGLRSPDGSAWFPPAVGVVAALAGGALVSLGMAMQPRRPNSILWTTVLVMAIVATLFPYGYARADASMARPLANQVWTIARGADVYSYTPQRHAPLDYSIYLNKTVVAVARASDIPPATQRPQLVLLLKRKNEPEAVLPGEWREVGHIEDGRNRWVVVRRQP